ncbi:MAG: hypothetical protein QG596_1673, partial [Actinomycetota bacterium]|nr:hypothetical protein [Actinomycetota bacterium]
AHLGFGNHFLPPKAGSDLNRIRPEFDAE